MSYYVIGFDPDVGRWDLLKIYGSVCLSNLYIQLLFFPVLLCNIRFFRQYLLILAVNQMAASLFRFIGGAARNIIVANVFGAFMLLIFMGLGGFILVRGKTSSFFRSLVLFSVAFS